MSDVTILIPMAGHGSRFSKAGYGLPKPFIDVGGRPMITRVMDNLRLPGARYVLIARAAHVAEHRAIVQGIEAEYAATFLPIDVETEGTAATLLFARNAIPARQPVVVANCDQIVVGGLAGMAAAWSAPGVDGCVMVFRDCEANPKWSFVRLDPATGAVLEAREKQPISDLATVGIYHFARFDDFCDVAVESIIRNERVNGEFYTCPVYNRLIARGARILAHEIAPSAMHGIGIPEDLDRYLAAGMPC